MPAGGPHGSAVAKSSRRGSLVGHTANAPLAEALCLFLLQRGRVLQLIQHPLVFVGARGGLGLGARFLGLFAGASREASEPASFLLSSMRCSAIARL
jgi:hypothetical protein